MMLALRKTEGIPARFTKSRYKTIEQSINRHKWFSQVAGEAG
jgi:hypothetical protein